MDDLRQQAPVTPLTYAKGLTLSARDHARDQGPIGAMGHIGTDGSKPHARIKLYCKLQKSAENLQFGNVAPRDIVKQLLIDDGVPNLGHRKNIFLAEVDRVGVAIGPHKNFGRMCVQNFASGYNELADKVAKGCRRQPRKGGDVHADPLSSNSGVAGSGLSGSGGGLRPGPGSAHSVGSTSTFAGSGSGEPSAGDREEGRDMDKPRRV